MGNDSFTMDDLGSAGNVAKIIWERGEATQAEVAVQLGVTVAAANMSFRKLADEKFILPLPEERRAVRGRPTRKWRMNTSENLFFGAVIESESLLASLVDFDGNLLWSEVAPTDHELDLKRAEAWLAKSAGHAIRKAESMGWPVRCGYVGVAGAMSHDGVLRKSVNFPNLVGLEPERLLKSRFGLVSHADSLTYPYYLGEVKDRFIGKTAMVVYWDMGVNAVIGSGRSPSFWADMTSGKFRGVWEFGHMRVRNGGRMCPCGRIGCLEEYVGARAILAAVANPKARDISSLACLCSSDAGARKAVADASKELGAFLGPMTQLFGIEKIIVSGPMSALFQWIRPHLREGLSVILAPEEIDSLQVEPSADPRNALTLGAGLSARHVFFNKLKMIGLRGLSFPDSNRKAAPRRVRTPNSDS